MSARKTYLLILVLVEWFSLIAQCVLHMQASPAAPPEALLRFFTFFTITTNILVAIYATNQLLTSSNNQTGFFARPSVQTAIALYILIVGLVYNTVLRSRWPSSGLQAVLHDLLHTVAPLMVLIYWWKWVDTRRLTFSNIPAWLIYPAVYAIIVILRGHFAGWYPYFFLEAPTLGYPRVFMNSALLVGVFLLFSFAFVFLGKRKPV